MKKHQLIQGIWLYIDNKLACYKGEEAFLKFLAYFLENLAIPHDEKVRWQIDQYLPKLLVAAHEQLRTSPGPVAEQLRMDYEKETGHKIPNLTNLGQSPIADQSMEICKISRAIGVITTKEYVAADFNTYCFAQQILLLQKFDEFAQMVYQQGLFEIIRYCKAHGMNGRFSETYLRSYKAAGQITFTFCRRNGERSEPQVSFVGDASDPLLLSTKIQSVNTDIHTCMSMIGDVIKHWPFSTQQRKLIFAAEHGVELSVVAIETDVTQPKTTAQPTPA